VYRHPPRPPGCAARSSAAHARHLSLSDLLVGRPPQALKLFPEDPALWGAHKAAITPAGSAYKRRRGAPGGAKNLPAGSPVQKGSRPAAAAATAGGGAETGMSGMDGGHTLLCCWHSCCRAGSAAALMNQSREQKDFACGCQPLRVAADQHCHAAGWPRASRSSSSSSISTSTSLEDEWVGLCLVLPHATPLSILDRWKFPHSC
jgi:hypothetical protein